MPVEQRKPVLERRLGIPSWKDVLESHLNHLRRQSRELFLAMTSWSFRQFGSNSLISGDVFPQSKSLVDGFFPVHAALERG
jgi:hypothetical protein